MLANGTEAGCDPVVITPILEHAAPELLALVDVNGAAFHPVYNPVGFEKDLPEFADTQYRQFSRVCAAFRQFGQFLEDFTDFLKYIVGAFRRIMCRNPGVQFLQVICCVPGQEYPVGHSAFVPFGTYLLYDRSGRLYITRLDLAGTKCKNF